MNLQAICRVCINQNSDMLSIFEPYSFSMRHNCEIFKVIIDCASVQIQELDGFSGKICRRCLEHLSQAYSFKKLCEASDYKFRNNLILRNQIEIKNEFYEEDTSITFNDIHNKIYGSTEEKSKIADFELIEVKEEQYDDEITTGNKNSNFQDELKKEEPCDTFNNLQYKEPSNIEETLDNNIKTHQVYKRYKCEFCDKSFTRSNHLTRHIRFHTGEQPYKCNFCEKKFTLKHYLVAHIRIHTGEKPFKCDLCEKKFTQNTHLVEHIRIHNAEKRFKCDFCQKKFKQNSTLLKHLKLHLDETCYSCEVCHKQFTQKHYLAAHVRIHTRERQFKCEFCEKIFTQKRYLVAHSKTHTEEGKRYKCDLCDKKFTQSKHLKRHIMVHSGHESYKCDLCEKTFTLNSHLMAHIRSHTGEHKHNIL